MSKSKGGTRSGSKDGGGKDGGGKDGGGKDGSKAKGSMARGTRETIESIAVAVILAFLFRAFIAEAFVIPTGSMAPALQGSHKDVVCVKCGHNYRTGASIENDDRGFGGGFVVATTCPICRFTMTLDPVGHANQRSFSGDRILVSKFAFDLFRPRRWDVIVFKYPGNAKQNYIKRLIGLPGEAIKLWHGDVYVKAPGDTQFGIARKPPSKVKAMLQLVDDTQHIAPRLVEGGWPSRWQPFTVPGDDRLSWQQPEVGCYRNDGASAEDSWLRYHHIVPDYSDWKDLLEGQPGDYSQRTGQLITDFYAYNAYSHAAELPTEVQDNDQLGQPPEFNTRGMHWVGDLGLEADVNVERVTGELLLDLVEAGAHYGCRIDVATGVATLGIDGGGRTFSGPDGAAVPTPQATTPLRGAGRYSIRYANVDNQIHLWINNRYARFSSPTTYVPPENEQPTWSVQDPGDIAPVGIGTRGTPIVVHRLRVLRDVYYIATETLPYQASPTTDYDRGYDDYIDVQDVFNDPTLWAGTKLFASRRSVEFALRNDEFFPLGDNSPQSKDARLWEGGRPAVRGRLLTGKAILIYWPHAWNAPIPMLPNFQRMGFIR